MKVDLSTLFKEVGKSLKLELTEDVSYSEDSLKLSAPVSLDGKVINTGKSVLLTGNIKTKVIVECARCLEPFEIEMDVDIEEQYCKSISDYKEITGAVELSDADFVYLIDEEDTISLDEVIRQNIITHLPIRAICSDKCPGIKTESKKEDNIDPRLAKLKELLQET